MPTQVQPPRPRLQPVPAVPPAKPVSPFYRLVATPASTSLALGRLILGAVMFPHACQKIFGWFGGAGWSGTIQGFREHLGLPPALSALVMLAEFLGSIGLILGLFGRVAAVGIIAVMAGAIAIVHAKVGFFMNWMGGTAGEGFEYHLLAIGLAIAIVGWGSGAFSVDRAIEVSRRHDARDAG
jgi:putative oxidoreductase